MNPYEPPARALIYASLMVLIGLPIGTAVAVLPVLLQHHIDTQPIIERARRVLVLAPLALVAGALALFIAQVMPLDLGFTTPDEWVVFTRDSLLGQMTLARVTLGALALIGLMASRRPAQWMIVSAVIALLAQATVTRTSHSAAMSNGDWLPIAADLVHLLAGGLWGGGLVALLIATRGSMTDVGTTRSMIRRFSSLGIASVALVIGTGLLLSAARLPNANALTTTQYGQLLLLKIGGVVSAVVLAGLHKFVSQRRMQSMNDVRAFIRTLRIEACVVFAVFAIAAALAASEPPHKTMTHIMDGTTMSMSLADTNFERLLTFAAAATITAGIVALALEWRARSQTNS